MVTSRDPSVRSLEVLQQTASTSRLLNLLAIAKEHGKTPEYRTEPFFRNHLLNQSLILKHRLRDDERFVFSSEKHAATKVIIPFDRQDLTLGGKSFFVGQRGWTGIVNELTGREDSQDISLLGALDSVPSLDPFLLREHLVRQGFSISTVYFAISASDLERMHDFVAGQIRDLISMAFPGNSHDHPRKMANYLMSNRINDYLEPLRDVLRLDSDSYQEGIFCWKGFLYYKWALVDMGPRVARLLKELPLLQGFGDRGHDQKRGIESAKTRLRKAIQDRRKEVIDVLKVYDTAYLDLTRRDKPTAFRDFLINAPALFMVLGERIGAISHLASFWQYRFKDSLSLTAPTRDIIDLLTAFEGDMDIKEGMGALNGLRS